MGESKRDQLVDILKGIGIICVVLGHGGVLLPGLDRVPTTAFVYLFHLMVFFFAAGMVYRPEKYRDPYAYIGRQIGGSAPLYMVYGMVFLLLHNVFAGLGLLNLDMYTPGDVVAIGGATIIFNNPEPLLGPLWFVPMFLLAKAFFAIAFQTAERLRHKTAAHAAVIIGFGILGLILTSRNMNLSYRMQLSILGVPVIYLGYWFSRNREKVMKLATPVSLILCTVVMLLILKFVGYIELSQNRIISPLWFYPVTVVGLLFCLSLAQIIRRWDLPDRLVSYLGKISFHIMASHLFVFKVFDWVFCGIIGADRGTVTRFPTSFDGLGLVYTLPGIAVPAAVVYLVRRIRARIAARKAAA